MRLQDLKEREYLTAAEAAKLFGHGKDFWVKLFDAGSLEGYRFGKRGDRHIRQDSIRAYLESLSRQTKPKCKVAIDLRGIMEDWHRKRQATQGS